MTCSSSCSPFKRLKIISIAAAFLQIIVVVVFILYHIEKIIDLRGSILEIFVTLLLIVFFIINIIFTSCFIYGAITNEPKHMGCYGLTLLINIVFLLLQLQFNFFVMAVVEFYVFWCLIVLKKEYKQLTTPNDPESPPPTYNACNDNTLAAPLPQSNAQNNDAASRQIIPPDPQVDPPPPATLSESSSLNGSVKGLIK